MASISLHHADIDSISNTHEHGMALGGDAANSRVSVLFMNFDTLDRHDAPQATPRLVSQYTRVSGNKQGADPTAVTGVGSGVGVFSCIMPTLSGVYQPRRVSMMH